MRDRVIEFALEKKDSGPYWKRLVKEEKKQHWLKIDFNKWRDEDESDEEAGGGQDLEEVKLIWLGVEFNDKVTIIKDTMEFPYGVREEWESTGGSCGPFSLA